MTVCLSRRLIAEALDTLPVPRRDIFSASFRLNKEQYLKELRDEEDKAKA